MLYRFLADGVVLAHFAFVLFVLFGGLLVLRWRWVAWVHLPAAVWGAAIELLGWICPLTPLENQLRRAGGAAGYPGAFVEHYVIPVIYPTGLTRELQWLAGLVVIALNVGIYVVIWRRRAATRSSNEPELRAHH